MFDKKLFNVIFLGLAFMLIFTAFQTCGIIENLVLDGIKDEDKSYNGNAYVSLAIIYAVLAIANWLSPSILIYTGPKLAMLIGGVTYAIFIANFLYPLVWGLYLGSVIIGAGAALIWTGQGTFLTVNSDSDTMARNSGLFWAMLQCSLLFGNLFVYFKFEGQSKIHSETRMMVFGVLLGVGIVGILVLLVLRGGGRDVVEDNTPAPSPRTAFVNALKLFKTKEMLLLSITFAYTGIELCFFSGVYGACLGHSKQFGSDSSKYAGISGMLIGCGEILGGAIFGLLGKKTIRFGRDPIVLLGYVVHILAFYLIFINIPDSAPIRDTFSNTFIQPSNIYLALACSFFLGFGDSCFNTQLYSILGTVYSEDSAPAFALFKFVQSLAAAVAFFYSDQVILRYQLLIMVILGTIGTLSFFQVEWEAHRKVLQKTEDQLDKGKSSNVKSINDSSDRY